MLDDLHSEYVPADEFFGLPFIDVNELRDTPVKYRLVQGGFAGTVTKFSFYFPMADVYEDRLLHFVEAGIGGHHDTVLYDGQDGFPWVRHTADLEDAFRLGAYLIESNQGHEGDFQGLKGDQSILDWRANAEVARFSKFVAERIYGRPPRYSYMFGACGGAFRLLTSITKAPDLWDGCVPYTVSGNAHSILASIQANALRILQPDAMAGVNDALDAGGSGDPFAGLTQPQAEAMALLYKSGFPRHRSLDGVHEQIRLWNSAARNLRRTDPAYFEEFWTKPGHVGHDRPAEVERHKVEVVSTVRQVLTAEEVVALPWSDEADWFGVANDARLAAQLAFVPRDKPMAVVLEVDDVERMSCSTIKVLSGEAEGRTLQVLGVIGDVVVCHPSAGDVFDGVVGGDRVEISNKDYLAWCYYHRHQENPEFKDANMVDGVPVFPRRPHNPFVKSHDFSLKGKKAIVLQNMEDTQNWPCCAPKLVEKLRADPSASLRLWFLDHAHHFQGSMSRLPETVPSPTSRHIDFEGCLHQAIRDLIAWVEFGEAPPADTDFALTADNEVILGAPETRGGIQPHVSLTADGGTRAEAAPGEAVTFAVSAALPPGAGRVDSFQVDFEGRGAWQTCGQGGQAEPASIRFTLDHAYEKPGVYFPTVKITTVRPNARFEGKCEVTNLGRMRVIVGPRRI